MSLTLISRETFQGVGTLNSATPGNLGTVTGSFFKRAGGPRLASDATANGYGWSADFHNAQASTANTINGGSAQTLGLATCWYYPTVLGDGAAGHYATIIRGQTTVHGYEFMTLAVGPNGNLCYITSPNPYTWVDTGVAAPKQGWYEFRLAWQQVSGSTYNAGLYLRAAGSATFTTVVENLNFTLLYGDALNTVGFGSVAGYGGGYVAGRIGMPSIYAMGAWSDRLTVVPDVVDPAGVYNWFCNAATGSDANDGTTAATAWASAAKVNVESQYCGMFPRGAGPGNGDTLTIDGTTTPLDLGAAALQIQTQGLTLALKGTEPIKAWKDVSAASTAWALASGATKTYASTDGNAADLTGVVLWENDKWLAHPFGSGSSFSFDGTTTYASALAACEAVPGSFFSDGATLYLHPFGDTNPASDGKTYTRSRYRTANSSTGGSAVLVQASDVTIRGDAAAGQVCSYTDRLGGAQSFRASKIWKTCLARATDNDPYNGYAVQWDTGSGGSCSAANLFLDYFAKHGAGRTANASNLLVTRTNLFYGQGSPYVSFGGQTQDVDYVDSGTGNAWAYVGCASVVNVGVIGSTAGAANTSQQSWISHAGGGNNFTGGSWTGCSLCSVLNGQNGTVGPVTITGSVFAGGFMSCATLLDQSRTTSQPMTLQAAGQTLTVTNSVLAITAPTNTTYLAQLTGNLVLRGSVVDVRGNTTNTAGGSTALWSKLASAGVTMQNVLFLCDAGKNIALFDGFASTDALAFDHNAYVPGSAGLIVQAYNDGTTTASRTFAQWQTAGKDTTGSFTTAAPKLNANDSLQSGSPLINAGTNLGPLADYTGKTFATRNDIGAFEFVPVVYTDPNPGEGILATWKRILAKS